MNGYIMRVQPTGGRNLVSTGNAREFTYGINRVLLSYGTPVAVDLQNDFEVQGWGLVPAGLYRTETRWSQTTACHLGRWGAGNAEELPQAVIEEIYQKISRTF